MQGSVFSSLPIAPAPTIPRKIDDMTKFPGSGVTKPTCDCTRRPELAQFCSDQCCDKRSAFVKDQLRKRINIDCCGACYRTVQRKSKHKLDVNAFAKLVFHEGASFIAALIAAKLGQFRS